MGEKRTQATGRPPQPRGLVVAAALLLGASLAVMALPHVLGFQDSHGMFFQVGLSVLFTTILGAGLALSSRRGIKSAGTEAGEIHSRYDGWRPMPLQPGDLAYIDRSGLLRADRAAGRFPGPATFRSSRGRWSLALMAGLVLCLGVLLAAKDDPIVLWVFLALIGSATIRAGVELLPGAASLTLDEQGFEVTDLFRRRRHRWADVSRFDVLKRTAIMHAVVFDVIGKEGILAGVSTIIAGHTGGLSENYGFGAEDLARLLNYWRASALARSAAGGAALSDGSYAEVAAPPDAALNSPS